jgi:hypothetical protein
MSYFFALIFIADEKLTLLAVREDTNHGGGDL